MSVASAATNTTRLVSNGLRVRLTEPPRKSETPMKSEAKRARTMVMAGPYDCRRDSASAGGRGGGGNLNYAA